MNMIFKLVFFSIFLNLSVGLLHTAIPQSDTIIMKNISSDIVQWQTSVGNNTNPTDTVQQSGLFSFLGLGDFIVLQKVWGFLTHIESFAFGFVEIIRSWFGGILLADNPALYYSLFSLLYTVCGLAYAMGLFYLFTNKRVDDYG